MSSQRRPDRRRIIPGDAADGHHPDCRWLGLTFAGGDAS